MGCSMSPWGCAGLLKSRLSFLSRGASEDTPSVSVSLETGGELRKEAHTARPLLLLSVESAPLPQHYPASWEEFSQINCRKTRTANTFIRITWLRVHVMALRMPESHLRAAELEPPKVGSRNQNFEQTHQVILCPSDSEPLLQDADHGPHTQRCWGGKGSRGGKEGCSNGGDGSLFCKPL